MPSFAYEAVDSAGGAVRGVESASSEDDAERSLRERGLRPLSVEPADAREDLESRGYRRRKADVAHAFRYLSTLLAAGFPLDDALGTVRGLLARDDVASAVAEARDAVRGGERLADALEAREDVFPPLAVGMVRAGEQGGRLPDALERLAAQLEREEELRSRIVSALLYPAMMAGVGGLALLVLVFYVLPKFVTILEETGASLPATTSVLLSTSGFLGDWWPALAGALVLAVGGAAAYLRSDRGRRQVSHLLLRMPVVGPLRRRSAASRFGRSLAELLQSGLPIVAALDAASASLADPAAAAEVASARRDVRTGRSLADALGDGRAFPPLFLRMTSLGEESGRLPEMLHRAASVAEDELERRLERMVRLVEPTLVVVFGVVVGFVALSLLQAIYGVRLQSF
jgi:type II secretory pathway component PulF